MSAKGFYFRKLYFGNIPVRLDERDFKDFLGERFEDAGGLLEPGNPALSVTMDTEKGYAFVEFR